MTPDTLLQRLLRQLGLYHPHEQRLSAITLQQRLKVVCAAFIALGLVAQVSSTLLAGSSYILLLASMGASAVLLFGIPNSPLARPWVFLAGHLFPATIGLACSHLFNNFPLMAATTIAVVLFVMYLLECMHPPGGATALVPVIATTAGPAPGLEFLLYPVGLNLLVMLSCALLLQRYWLKAKTTLEGPGAPATADAKPLDRLQLQHSDLASAIESLDRVLDISETDLLQLYHKAQQHAFSRHSQLLCRDIMAKDLLTITSETPLQTAWQLLRRHKVSMLPVIDQQRQLVGIFTLVDVVKDLTESDLISFRTQILSWFKPKSDSKRATVGDWMNRQLVTVNETDHIAALIPLLAHNGLHQVPVLNAAQQLCGIITQSDLLATLIQQQPLQQAV
jgi:CBS domain-containing membrane protein